MTPAQARAMYIRQIRVHGEFITLRRIAGTTTTEVQARARVMGYVPDELIGDIQQGDRKIILMPDGLVAAGGPGAVERGDQVVVRGDTLTIERIDDNTRRIAGELIAYEITARG